jgi:hypothetical protein
MPTPRSTVPTATAPAPAAALADAEWLLTDGAGGYACGAVDGVPRRRYHGLWVARPAGSARRFAVVSGLDERVVVGERTASIWRAHWADQPTPARPEADVAFAPGPLPAWTIDGDGFALTRSVALRRVAAGQPPVCLVRWRNRGTASVRLLVRPLLGWCDADHLPPADERFDGALAAQGASWGVRPDERLPTLWLTADGVAACRSEPAWYRGFHFATDRERGYDFVGDRWSPGVLELDVGPGHAATVAFALAAPCDDPAAVYEAIEAAAARAQRDELAARDRLFARLLRGADDFL